MKQYQKMQKDILEKGTYKPAAREGMPGTTSLFGYQNRYNLMEGFPIVTTKEINFENIVHELLWILGGDTNVRYLVENGCNIWNEDAYNYYLKQCKKIDYKLPMGFKAFVDNVKNGPSERKETFPGYKLGDCGKQYGWLWREFGKDDWKFEEEGVDQLKVLVKGLLDNPMSRRHIINAWNPSTLDDMALHPCHVLVQFNCRPLTKEEREKFIPSGTSEDLYEKLLGSMPEYYLDCQMYQRSADSFLGVPYNISSYSLLTILLCNLLNMVPGEFIHSFGDLHIYDNHVSQTTHQLTRLPKKLPKLEWSEGIKNIFKSLKSEKMSNEMKSDLIIEVLETLESDDVWLKGYRSHPAIKAKLSTGLI